jgi:hypothetical protein
MAERGSSGVFEKAKRLGMAAAAVLAAESLEPGCATSPEACAPTVEVGRRPRIERNAYFDGHPEYLVPVEGGEFSASERKERLEVLKGGEQIFHDIGLDFYKVRAGDNPTSIRKKLAKYPEYAHLAQQTNKLHSFNIPSRSLQVDMWLPIPLENEDRQLTDEQFAGYAKEGIDDLKGHTEYGPIVRSIIEEVGESDLVATMIAVAKQESGGLPLGQFELHRWEKKYRAFSFSMFHVLMEKNGPGLTARRELDLTEGQTYHPRNAVKLFIGFMAEKAGDPTKYFPVDQNISSFASFYNGTAWRRTNPGYDQHVISYYRAAQKLLKEHPELIDSGT